MGDIQTTDDLVGFYEQIPRSIEVLGIWTGEEDDTLTRKLTERGFIFRTQVRDEDILTQAQAEEAEPAVETTDVLFSALSAKAGDGKRLAILGPKLWEHSVINKGEIVGLTDRGEVTSFNPDYLAGGWRKKN